MTFYSALIGSLKGGYKSGSGANDVELRNDTIAFVMKGAIGDIARMSKWEVLFDFKFWQALGRFKKWEHSAYTYTVPEKEITAVHRTGLLTYIRREHTVTRKNRSASMKWRTEAKRCFSMLMEGKTPKDYFKTI